MDLDAAKTRFRNSSIEVEKIQRQMSFTNLPRQHAASAVGDLNLGMIDEDDELVFDDVYKIRGKNMRMSQSLGDKDYEEIRVFDGLQVQSSHEQLSERKGGEKIILNYTES